MMNWLFVRRLALVSVVVFIIASAASAFPASFPAPAINGPSGVVRIPSADVLPYKNFNVAADFGAAFIPGYTSTESAVYYKMNLGTFHGVEMGIVGGTEPNSSKLREGVFVNMKLSLSTGEEPDPMLLAIGVENLFSYTKTDVYMVATKYMKQGPKLTFGFMGDFPGDKFRPLGMAGIEIPLASTFFLNTDGMLGENFSQLNAGCRLFFTPVFALNVAALNVLDSKIAKDNRSALLGFSWANPF